LFDQTRSPLLSESRASTLKDVIQDEIVSGAIAFGERLPIAALAARYGSSHMPVREALRSLAGEGLVVAQANKGARVVSVTPQQVQHVFAVRVALEVVLAREATLRLSRSALIEIATLEKARLALVEAGKFGEAIAVNQRFHRQIYAASENSDAMAMLDRHWLLLAALWSRFGYRASRLAGVAADHDHMLRALHDRDAEAMGALTAAHVIKARQDLLAQMATPVPGGQKVAECS
jgi:DNA-binding GntR family transcriptional regulator